MLGLAKESSNDCVYTTKNIIGLIFEGILWLSRRFYKDINTWSIVGVYLTSSLLATTKSLMKWKWISTYFIWPCMTRFAARYLVLILSIRRISTYALVTCKSHNKDYSQRTSLEATEIDWYSTLALSFATTLCLEDIYDTRLSLK